MDTATRIADQLAYSTAVDIASGYAYGYDYTRDDFAARNAAGWTLELMSGDPAAAARGTVVRHEGLSLSADELERVWRRAVALVDSGEVC